MSARTDGQGRYATSARSGFMAGHATCFACGTTRARVKGSAQETVHAHASNGRRGDLARAVGPGTLVMDVVLGAMHL